MAHYYFDSSALIKRYVAESGSDQVRSICAVSADHTIYTVRVSGAEIVAALFAAAHRGIISLGDAQAAAQQFKHDFEHQYQIVEVTSQLVDAARTLPLKYRLHGYAAVQLAAALALHHVRTSLSLPPLSFVCADQAMIRAGQAEGLQIEELNLYHHSGSGAGS